MSEIHQYLNDPCSLDVEEALKRSFSSPKGISFEEANRRIEKFGPNEIKEQDVISPLKILLKQFKSALVFILLIAGVISLILGNEIDTWVIVSAILIDVAIGFFQEFRAQKAIRSLKKSIVHTTRVYRDNELEILLSSELVASSKTTMRGFLTIALAMRIRCF